MNCKLFCVDNNVNLFTDTSLDNLRVVGATDPRMLRKRESVISTAATMRVLNIIKHWVSKHSQVQISFHYVSYRQIYHANNLS